MGFLKNLFGGKDKAKAKADATPVRRISQEPIQSQADQDSNRLKMEAELDAARTARTDKVAQ